MHQNLAVILQQFNYGKNSLIVLIPGGQNDVGWWLPGLDRYQWRNGAMMKKGMTEGSCKIGRSHKSEPCLSSQARCQRSGCCQQGPLGHSHLFNFRFLYPLGLCPPVLEPDLHLCLGQVQVVWELGPFRDGQILLLAKFLLQGSQLLRRERRTRLPVRFVLSQGATQGSKSWLFPRSWKSKYLNLNWV